MKKREKKNEYISEGNMPKVWALLVEMHKNNPEAFEDETRLKTFVSMKWVSLKNKEKCPNCGANMLGLHFEFDCVNAAMLIEMGKVVRHQFQKGMTFTEANKVHVQSMTFPSYAMKSRTTQLSKLGLIAKVIGENGRQEGGMWLITRRGWAALRGEMVPRWVNVWRGEIEERTDQEVITIGGALQINREKVEAAMRRNKKIKGDYREYDRSYSSSDWAMFTSPHEGSLFG